MYSLSNGLSFKHLVLITFSLIICISLKYSFEELESENFRIKSIREMYSGGPNFNFGENGNGGAGGFGGGGIYGQNNLNINDNLKNPDKPQLESIYRGKVMWGNVSHKDINKEPVIQKVFDPNENYDEFGNPIITSEEIRKRPKPQRNPQRKVDVDEQCRKKRGVTYKTLDTEDLLNEHFSVKDPALNEETYSSSEQKIVDEIWRKRNATQNQQKNETEVKEDEEINEKNIDRIIESLKNQKINEQKKDSVKNNTINEQRNKREVNEDEINEQINPKDNVVNEQRKKREVNEDGINEQINLKDNIINEQRKRREVNEDGINEQKTFGEAIHNNDEMDLSDAHNKLEDAMNMKFKGKNNYGRNFFDDLGMNDPFNMKPGAEGYFQDAINEQLFNMSGDSSKIEKNKFQEYPDDLKLIKENFDMDLENVTEGKSKNATVKIDFSKLTPSDPNLKEEFDERLKKINENKEILDTILNENLDRPMNELLKSLEHKNLIKKRSVDNLLPKLNMEQSKLAEYQRLIGGDKKIEAIYKGPQIESKYKGPLIESIYKGPKIISQYTGPQIRSQYNAPPVMSIYNRPQLKSEYKTKNDNNNGLLEHNGLFEQNNKMFEPENKIYDRYGINNFVLNEDDTKLVYENLAQKYQKMNEDNNLMPKLDQEPQYRRRPAARQPKEVPAAPPQ